MKTHRNIYYKIYTWKNLVLAWRKARKGKTRKAYVIQFEENLIENLRQLQFELMTFTYRHSSLETFPIKDPKTRLISKSHFRDRVIHHALVNVIQDIFEKQFIHSSCANQKNKGTLFALDLFERYKRKVTNNLHSEGYCLKADIRHYFQEIDHKILMKIIGEKIKCEKTNWLISQILEGKTKNKNSSSTSEEFLFSKKKGLIGMPLGNLTSQFFANVYLNELDYFVKNILKARYYIRYVDDFVILHTSQKQLRGYRSRIDYFLKERLKIELHSQKSRIISLSRGVDFVGFRCFYHYRLLRKRNIRNFSSKLNLFVKGKLPKNKLLESFQGWNAYAKWADSYKLRKNIASSINKLIKMKE